MRQKQKIYESDTDTQLELPGFELKREKSTVQ